MTTHQLVMLVWSLVGRSVFIYLFFQTAPYGRHQEKGWGFEISSRWGWILMESPAFYLMLIFLILNFSNSSNCSIFASILFMIHYFNRSFIWPIRARIKNKSMPVTIALSAFLFLPSSLFFILLLPPRSTRTESSVASDVYKRNLLNLLNLKIGLVPI